MMTTRAILTILIVSLVGNVLGFSIGFPKSTRKCNSFHQMAKKENEEPQKKGFLDDLKGMFANFDDVVDDFVYKRMGAGEQWYGKRKYNPSGKFDGDYNGMGRSDQFRIELARVQKEEMEKRRLRRLAEEEARKNE